MTWHWHVIKNPVHPVDPVRKTLISKNRIIYRVLQVFAVSFIVPSTLFILIEYILLSPIIKINFASVRALNVGFSRVTLATHIAPMIMVLSIVDGIMNRYGLKVKLVDRLIKIFYPYLWNK
jgi:hypothetical protein